MWITFGITLRNPLETPSFALGVATTTYNEHQAVVQTNQNLQTSNKTLTSERDEARKERDRLKEENGSLKQKLSEKPTTITRIIPGVGGEDQPGREKRAKERQEISLIMRHGLQIEQKLLAAVPVADAINEGNDWIKQTYRYLGTIDVSNAARFDASGGPSYSHQGVAQPNEVMWNLINSRMETLKQMLQELNR